MKNNDQTSGLILIELVATLILVGIIGIFTGFFLYTGINGYMTTKETSEGALLAQTALERISKELREIDTLPSAPVANTSVTFTSKVLPGQRVISYSSATNTISISVDGGTAWPLNNVKCACAATAKSPGPSQDGRQSRMSCTNHSVGTLLPC